MHHYPRTQCPQEPLEPAEAEEAEEAEVEAEEAEAEAEEAEEEVAPPHHPTQKAFEVSHLPSSMVTAPEVTPSYANSNATND